MCAISQLQAETPAYARSLLRLGGTLSLNIRDGSAISGTTGQMVNAGISSELKPVKHHQRTCKRHVGAARNGFDMCSLQFAIHYMFKDARMLNGCLRNVSELVRTGGYFVGTCYDGARVFSLLAGTKTGDSKTIMKQDTKIWQVTKQYDEESFKAGPASLGMAIDVYQESIGKASREYLVNMSYLKNSLEAYGFQPADAADLSNVGIASAIGNFGGTL